MLSDVQVITELSCSQLESFAAFLAGLAQKRDVIALYGDLGAGKTVFARAFIRALTHENEDVPSPTFTLVQTYEADPQKANGHSLSIWHFDLYRLKTAQEIYEIGFEEALSSGISLIEWPQRAERLLRDRLEIHIQIPAEKPDKRNLTLTAYGKSWLQRMENDDLCRNALNF